MSRKRHEARLVTAVLNILLFSPPFFFFPGFKLLYLLDVVRNGIRTQNMRLTFTLTLFIAKAALQILKPGTADRTRLG